MSSSSETRASAQGAQLYVSVTGLRLRSAWHAPRFWWHAIRSMRQAQQAPGNLLAQTRTIDGVHHTLSVWTGPASMRRYLQSGSHGNAMRAFDDIATGSTFGYLTDRMPDWTEALQRWKAEGRQKGRPAP